MKVPKVEIKKILYATDLSESALFAFSYAVSLANLYNASITILHVLFEEQKLNSLAELYVGRRDWLKIKEQTYDMAREALIGKKREHIAIREVLHKFSEDVKSENGSQSFITDEIVIKNGNPDDIILDQVQERNCDIVVMGTHGQGTIANALIGSTARRVLRRSKKPVFVIPLPRKG